MTLDYALKYAEYGWAVFPLLPRSKAPATPNGFHDATTNADALKALWGTRKSYNIGLATGKISRIWVLDIDPEHGGDKTLEELENKYGSLPETLVSHTGSGGKHYFFGLPDGVEVRCTVGKLGPGIDTRGEGGYVAIPPSVHPNGTPYEFEDRDIKRAPEWLIKLVRKACERHEIAPVPDLVDNWTTEDVHAMLAAVDPNERETWIQVGMALHDGGWPCSMWDSWSRGSPKYKLGEPFRIWAGFKPHGGVTMGTLVHMAQEGGWVPKTKPLEEINFKDVDGVDLSEIRNKFVKLPSEEINIPVAGLIGETLNWINSTAIQLQPELTLLNIITALGAVFGRRYALQGLDTRTNIYTVGIADTGHGKDNSRKRMKRLLQLAGLEDFLGPDEIRSGPGLLLELKHRPSMLMNIDEIGMFMRNVMDSRAPGYMKEISKLITHLFTDSASTYTGGLIASKPDERVELKYPNLCIYGTTTLEKYAEAMKSEAITSGELTRFIVLKPTRSKPEKNMNAEISDPPEHLITRWQSFKPTAWEQAPDFVEVQRTPVLLGDMKWKVDELWNFEERMLEDAEHTGFGIMWSRFREKVLKVAMISAIVRDHKNPKLILSDLEFGERLVKASVQFMARFAADSMYDNDFQKLCAKFIMLLESGVDIRTAMIRRLKIREKELNEIEKTLKEMGKIDYSERIRPRIYKLLTENKPLSDTLESGKLEK